MLGLMEKTFLIRQLKVIEEHMLTFVKLQQVKEMVTQLVLAYNYFNKHYKMITIDLSKRQGLDTDTKNNTIN